MSADCVPQYGRIYVFCNRYISITASEVLPPNNHHIVYSLAPNWAKNSVRYQEIFRRDTISRYQSQQLGIWIQYLDVSHLVVSHDMVYDINIYRDISFDIAPGHLGTPGKYKFNENPSPRCGLLFFFFHPGVCPHLGLSSVWSLPSSFCCPPAGHVIALTVPPNKEQPYPLRNRPAA